MTVVQTKIPDSILRQAKKFAEREIKANFSITGVARRRTNRCQFKALGEIRVRWSGKSASRKSGFVTQTLTFVASDNFEAETQTFFRVVDFALIKIAQRQQRTANDGKFQPQTVWSFLKKFAGKSRAQNAVAAARDADKIIKTDNRSAVGGG